MPAEPLPVAEGPDPAAGGDRATRFGGATRMRALLRRVWPAFFQRHGNVLPIQLAAIPIVRSGQNCLISAPTAGGKTEAALAPLLERALDEQWRPLAIVVVSPTRALVNDLYRRLERPLGLLGVTLGRRTGDHPESLKKHQPFVLVTTPESLDSILTRHPDVLAGVRALVLDEIHCLDGSARGDQLATLVARVRRSARKRHGVDLQTIALSATLGDREEVARRYLGVAAIVHLGATREIMAIDTRYESEAGFATALASAVAGMAARKVLVFVNRRQDAERFAAALRGQAPFGQAVFAHHGSLEREVRESIERRFLTAQRAICVATMTLELGIDIGDVDLVALTDPPNNVQSFLQRIGRGNRRRRDVSYVLLGQRDAAAVALFALLADSARAGRLHAPIMPFHPAVLAQQALSLLYQNRERWVSAEALHERLPDWVQGRFSKTDVAEVLASLAAADLLDDGGGRYRRTRRSDALFERGELHANIDAEAAGLDVVERATGRRLGLVAGVVAGDPSKLTVGGQAHAIVRQSGKVLYVRAGAEGAGIPSFPPRGRPLVTFELAQALRESLGLAATAVPVLEVDGTAWLFHFAGTLAGLVLATWFASQPGGGEVKVRGFALGLAGGLPAWQTPGAAELERAARASSDEACRRAQMGPFARFLPDGLRQRFAVEAVDVPRLAALAAGWRPVHTMDRALVEVLCGLVGR